MDFQFCYLRLVAWLAASASFGLALHDEAGATMEPAGFCRIDAIVHNYWRGLPQPAKGRRLNQSGRLRFGPSALRLYPPRENGLIVIGHGYFSLRGDVVEAVRARRRRLEWVVVSQLERLRVRKSGPRLVKRKARRVARIGDFQNRQFGFPAFVRPGIYRLKLRFVSGRTGRTLGQYAAIFRAVRSRLRLGLATNRETFRAGQSGYFRVENHGTVPVFASSEYRMWRLTGNRRTRLWLPLMMVANSRSIARAGFAAPCVKFEVPPTADPGRYAVGVEVEGLVPLPRRTLLAGFNVVSG